MEPPTLSLQFSCSKILLVCALLVVEDEEEGIHVEFFEEEGVFEHGEGGLRVVERDGVGGFREVVFWSGVWRGGVF